MQESSINLGSSEWSKYAPNKTQEFQKEDLFGDKREIWGEDIINSAEQEEKPESSREFPKSKRR